VIYVGHSGVGENMRLQRMIDGSGSGDGAPTGQVFAELAAAPYQLVAFLSCYSYMYFGLDLIATEANKGHPRREFLFTGTPFSAGDRGTLAVLTSSTRCWRDRSGNRKRGVERAGRVSGRACASSSPRPLHLQGVSVMAVMVYWGRWTGCRGTGPATKSLDTGSRCP